MNDSGDPSYNENESIILCDNATNPSVRQSQLSPQSSSPKKVRFGCLQIQEHDLVLGDNPGCSSGVPIQLSWKPSSKYTINNIQLYEYMRTSIRTSNSPRRIPAKERKRRLIEKGYTPEDIDSSIASVETCRKLRSQTLDGQGWDRMMITMISVAEKLPKGVQIQTFTKEKRDPLSSRGAKLLKSTGRSLRHMVQPKQETKSARTA